MVRERSVSGQWRQGLIESLGGGILISNEKGGNIISPGYYV